MRYAQRASQWLDHYVFGDAAAGDNAEDATPWLRVFAGTSKRGGAIPFATAPVARPTSGYGSRAPISPEVSAWLATAFRQPRRVLTCLSRQLFHTRKGKSSDEMLARAMFAEQINRRTVVLTGQFDRRCSATVIRDMLAHRLCAKDAHFILMRGNPGKRILDREPTAENAAMFINRALAYANVASIWAPANVAELLECATLRIGNARPMSVLALTGSWATPAVAALRRPDLVSSMLLVDVIREYDDVMPDLQRIGRSQGQDATCHIGGSENGDALVRAAGKRRFDVAVWNPPYWCVEIYDARDSATSQPASQSTHTSGSAPQTFNQWLHAYVTPTAASAARLVPTGGWLAMVVPSAIRLHSSFVGKVPFALSDHVGVGPSSGHPEICDFGEQMAAAVELCAHWKRRDADRDGECLRVFSQGSTKNREMCYWFRRQ
jgi:hypothetical protein